MLSVDSERDGRALSRVTRGLVSEVTEGVLSADTEENLKSFLSHERGLSAYTEGLLPADTDAAPWKSPACGRPN